MPSKYGNRKIRIDGMVFDSGREAERYYELRLLERAGKISGLRRQVPYVLIPAQKGERACKYIADFVYMENGEEIVEDCKGYRTEVYRLKRKMMLYIHGIKIRET